MSEYALDGIEALELNGVCSKRHMLFEAAFETSNVEQFSSVYDMRMLSKAVFQFLNLGKTNAAKFTVYGAVDPAVKWEPLPNAQDIVLAAEVSVVKSLSDAYGFVRVGVVSNAAGQSTPFQVLVEGKSR